MRPPLLSVAIAASALLLCTVSSAAAVGARAQDLPIGACKLTAGADLDVSLGFDRPTDRVAPLGIRNVTFLLVDFADAPVTAAARSQVKATISGVQAFISQQSYGRLAITPLVVDRWLRMPRTAAAYTAADNGSYAAHKAYLQDAIAAGAVDLSRSDAVVVLASHNIGGLAGGAAFLQFPGGGIAVGGGEVINAVSVGTIRDGSDVGVLSHELLHTLGLADLYAPRGTAREPYPFTGHFDLMADVSATSPSMTAWEKWVLGWIDDSQVVCVGRGTRTVTLAPLETVGGVKAVVAPIGDDRAVVVERRAAVGSDADGPAGVVVYLVDPQRESGHGPIRFAHVRGFVMTPLSPGKSITLDGVRVSVNGDDRIVVRVPGRPA